MTDDDLYRLYVERAEFNMVRKWTWAIIPTRILKKEFYVGSPVRDALMKGDCLTEARALRKGKRKFTQFMKANPRPSPKGAGYIVDTADIVDEEFEALKEQLRRDTT